MRLRRQSDVLYALIPGALIVVLGFRAGGYRPDTTALAAMAVGGLLALRVVSAPGRSPV